LSAVPDLTPDQMAMTLQRSADDWGPVGKDNDYGAGVLNVPKALQQAQWVDILATISGTVVDAATGDSLRQARVTVLGTPSYDETNGAGVYELYATPGLVTLEARAFGYEPDTLFISAEPGGMYSWDAALEYWPTGRVSGLVTDAFSGDPLAGARVDLANTPMAAVFSDSIGAYSIDRFPAGEPYLVRAVRFGNLITESFISVEADSSAVLDLVMEHGVFDDFEVDQGWIVGDPADTATVGIWERCAPVGTWSGGIPVQPDEDHTPYPGTHCYLTANGEPGSGPNQNDVDGGQTTLTSPLFDGSWYHEPVVSFWYWYSNDTGPYTDDTLKVEVSNNGGASWHPLMQQVLGNHAWSLVEIELINAVHLSDSMRIRFIAADVGGISTVEAAIDDFAITGAAYSSAEDPRMLAMPMRFYGARPNPLSPGGQLQFSVEQATEVGLEIFDPTGRTVRRFMLGSVGLGDHAVSWDGADQRGRPCPAGAYFARLMTPAGGQTRRLILIR